MRKRFGIAALALAGAVALVALFVPGAGFGDLFAGIFRSSPEGDAPAARDGSEGGRIEEELREHARLHGLPGFDPVVDGSGRLTGAVKVHVAAKEPRPLPGAEVEAVAVVAGRTVRLTTDTGADGAFAFDAAPAAPGYAVVVRSPPYKETVLRGVAVGAGRATDVGVVLLGAPTSLEGAVVDGAGRPVPGVVVQVLRDAPRNDVLDVQQALFDMNAATDALGTAQGDRDGRFVVEGLSPGRYVLRVAAPGYASVFREDVLVTLDERSAGVRVVLDAGAGWFGKVLGADGVGIPGARVIAVAVPGGPMSRLDRVEARSDADGAYRLDTLVPGLRYFLEAYADGWSPSGRFLVPSGVTELDLALVPAGSIEGQVRDAKTGAGIPEARVTAVAGAMNSLSPLSTVADAQGNYAFPAVSPGVVFVFQARAPGYGGNDFDPKSLGGRRVVAGEVLRIDADLVPGGTVRGRVASTDGRPVAYASVALLNRHRKWEGETVALTDVRGDYVLQGLRAAEYELRVTAAGYAPVVDPEQAKVVVGADLAPVTKDVVVARGGILRGALAGSDGSGVGGARVSLSTVNEELRARVRDLATVADAQGRWRIPGVPAAIQLRVVAEHDDYARSVSEPLTLALAEEREVAVAMRAGAKVPGRAVDERGRGVAEARVRWGRVAPGQEGRTEDAFRADQLLGTRVLRTDAEGRFLIDRLEGGRYVAKVEREGYSDWYRSDLQVPDEGTQPELVATMQGSLTIRGRVLDAATGAPIAECWVYAKEQDAVDAAGDPGKVKALVSAQSGKDGSYLLERVPPGRYEVAAWIAIGYLAAAQNGDDPSAKSKDVVAGSFGVDFRLRPEPPPQPPPK